MQKLLSEFPPIDFLGVYAFARGGGGSAPLGEIELKICLYKISLKNTHTPIVQRWGAIEEKQKINIKIVVGFCNVQSWEAIEMLGAGDMPA